jgi:hypothetical protein
LFQFSLEVADLFAGSVVFLVTQSTASRFVICGHPAAFLDHLLQASHPAFMVFLDGRKSRLHKNQTRSEIVPNKVRSVKEYPRRRFTYMVVSKLIRAVFKKAILEITFLGGNSCQSSK